MLHTKEGTTELRFRKTNIETEGYKYLEKLNEMMQKEMKDKEEMEYFRRLRLMQRSMLMGRNQI